MEKASPNPMKRVQSPARADVGMLMARRPLLFLKPHNKNSHTTKWVAVRPGEKKLLDV